MVMGMTYRTYIKSILRDIKQSAGRFIAIIAIVALGVGFLVGILSSTPDMKASVDKYYDDNNMTDIFIKATMGLTEEDVAEVASLEEVDSVMPAYVTDMLMQTSMEEVIVTRIYGVPLEKNGTDGFVNTLTLVEGRMPQADNECVVQYPMGDRSELPIGTVLTISEKNEDYNNIDDIFNITEYTVVGIVKSPFYFSNQTEQSQIGTGKIGGIIYVDESCYSLEVYTDLYITVAAAKSLEAFSEEYENYIKNVVSKIEDIAKTRVIIRHNEIIDEAVDKLNEAKAEYKEEKAKAEDELANGWQELEDARNTIQKAEAEYEDGLRRYKDGVSKLKKAEATIRDARNSLEEGEREYNDGAVQLNAAKKELEQSGVQLEKAYAELIKGEAAYQDGEEQILYARSELDGMIAKLSELENGLAALQGQYEQVQSNGDMQTAAYLEQQISELQYNIKALKEGISAIQEEIAIGEVQLDATRKQLDSGWNEYYIGKQRYEAGLAVYTEKEAQLAAARQELDKGWGELKAGEAEIARNLKLLEESKAELDKAKAELEKAKIDLAEGEAEYEKAKAEAYEEFAKAEAEIAKAEKEITDIETPEWFVLDRNHNVTYVSYKVNVEKVADIAKVFPIFFFLVAALVTLTTMTRMVEEERIQIGTLKALGYKKSVIMGKYLLYCGLASIIGCAVGLAGGFRLLPTVLNYAYATMYDLPPLITRFNPSYGLISCFAEIFCTLFATFAACWQSLKEKPAFLMLPRVPKAGQRIFLERIAPLWKHLPFSYKATARNIFRNKKHLLMTVIGIAGCTSLMVAGFGIKDSISVIALKQFKEIELYDMKIEYSNMDFGAVLNEFLQDKNYIAVYGESGTIIDDRENISTTIYVPESEEKFKEFIHLRNRRLNLDIPFEKDSVVVTEKMAETLGLSVGDTFILENTDGKTAEFTLTGITENYIGSYVYIGQTEYSRAFGEVRFNTLLVISDITDSDEQDRITELLLNDESISGVHFNTQTEETYNNLLSSMNFIVLVLIIAAGGLAVIVLYNITNVNINERLKELATLRVLGFHHSEVSRYIFREITILTVFGIIAGVFAGILLHRYVVTVADSVDLMLGRSIFPWSFIWSIIATLVFSAVVDVLMSRKLRQIKMAESMKAVD